MFTLLDDSDFPIVRYTIPDPPEARAGKDDRLLQDMDLLLARNQRFVLVSRGQHDRESVEVRQGRAVWFKENKALFAGRCLALIHIATDAEDLKRLKDQSADLSAALGVPLIVVSDDKEALQLAQSKVSSATEA